MSENNHFNSVIESLIKGMESFMSTKTVVGEATKVGDTIILPLVDVTFGVGAGAGSKTDKGNGETGCGGIGGKMVPSAVLVISNGCTKLVNVKNQDSVTKILDMVPDLVNKFTTPKKDAAVSDDDAVSIAFPEKEDEA